MNYIINYLKVLIVPCLVIFFFPLILAILNLIGLRSFNILILIIMIITSIISGILIGKKAIKKGYIHGLIFGGILVLLMFLLGFFGSTPHNLNSLIYYLIIVIATVIGSMIGIGFKPIDQEKTSP